VERQHAAGGCAPCAGAKLATLALGLGLAQQYECAPVVQDRRAGRAYCEQTSRESAQGLCKWRAHGPLPPVADTMSRCRQKRTRPLVKAASTWARSSTKCKLLDFCSCGQIGAARAVVLESYPPRCETAPSDRPVTLFFSLRSHRVSRINIRLLGHKIKHVKPLGEAEATAAGADFFGEVFIYGISVAALLAEVYRQDRQNAGKELKKKQRQVEKEERLKQRVLDIEGHFQARIAELDQRVIAMQATLDDLTQRNEAAAKKRWNWL
jgi:hypothetical protein